MRAIKFRVWIYNKFFYIDLSQGLGNIRDLVLNNESSLYQQFTGLKDKLGKEIYEGDIIKIKNNKKFRTKKVFYDSTCAAFCVLPVDWDENEEYSIIELLGQNTSLEVIGNIFENPELLKS